MSHYYEIRRNGEVRFLPAVDTPSKARKHGSALVSVTTLLGHLPNPYINDTWKPREYVRLARLHPELTAPEITSLMWGLRTCPETGKQISSSDFGTAAHARLEDHTIAWQEGGSIERNSPYDGIVAPTMRYLETEGFTPVASERMVACNELKTAGSIDLIAKKGGKLWLLDYKFRNCTKDEGKFYPKDCAQLAIEAKMVMQNDDLDYLPKCISLCVDSTTGKVYDKTWTEAACKQGVQRFIAARNLYYSLPELGLVDLKC